MTTSNKTRNVQVVLDFDEEIPMSENKKKKIPPITIENARLLYKNFSGTAKKFNAKGLRNFHVVLDLDMAKVIENDGWNVRWHEPREEGDPPLATLKVAVRFDNYPPRIVMITSENKTPLDEENVDILDWAEIKTVDLMLTPSIWEVGDKTGIKAYLKKMFITLVEDDLETKYSKVHRTPSSVDEEDGD